MATRQKKTAKKTVKKTAKKTASLPSVVHWEVQAKHPEKQQRFFSSLFGWRIDTNNPMGYGMVPSGGKDAIGGGIGQSDNGSRVTVYVQVPDVTQSLTKAELLGGKVLLPRTEMGPVIMGHFRDPEGNLIGLIED